MSGALPSVLEGLCSPPFTMESRQAWGTQEGPVLEGGGLMMLSAPHPSFSRVQGTIWLFSDREEGP